MTLLWMHLFFMLIAILVASMLFTNALEHFGHRMGLSAGVIGSLFAAIATALPEASVPIIAILAGTKNVDVNQQVGVGAIIGAPFMLSTLSIMLVGVFAIKGRGVGGKIHPEWSGFLRDLHFALIAFFIATFALFLPEHPLYWREGICALLVLVYLVYIVKICRASHQMVEDGYGVIPDETLYFSRVGLRDSMLLMLIQALFAFGLLLYGAKCFINDVESISQALKISVLLLSLLIIPIATELPEKINSILWIRQNKDTLSVGNITGAMVFQGTLLPAIGILLTPWVPSREVLTSILLTMLGVGWLRWNVTKEGIGIKTLFVNGAIYILYLTFMLL